MSDLGVITASCRLARAAKQLDVWQSGGISVVAKRSLSRIVRSVKWWLSPAEYLSGGDAGRIEGVITTGGLATPLSRVTLHYAPLGTPVSRALTNDLGEYKFGKNGAITALSPTDGPLYYVVAEDPTAENNARITDRITPSA